MLKEKSEVWASKHKALIGLVADDQALAAVLSCPAGQLASVQEELSQLVRTAIGQACFSDMHFAILAESVDDLIKKAAEDLLQQPAITKNVFEAAGRRLQVALAAVPQIEELPESRVVLFKRLFLLTCFGYEALVFGLGALKQ